MFYFYFYIKQTNSIVTTKNPFNEFCLNSKKKKSNFLRLLNVFVLDIICYISVKNMRLINNLTKSLTYVPVSLIHVNALCCIHSALLFVLLLFLCWLGENSFLFFFLFFSFCVHTYIVHIVHGNIREQKTGVKYLVNATFIKRHTETATTTSKNEKLCILLCAICINADKWKRFHCWQCNGYDKCTYTQNTCK